MIDLNPMNNCRVRFKAVCLKGEVYVLGCYDNSDILIKSVEKNSPSTNERNVVAIIFDERQFFCACAFIYKIFNFCGFISGGAGDGYSTTK